MDNARIIVIEDDPSMRESYKANLEVSDHTVVGEADSVAAAEALVDSLTSNDVEIAIVDGNLSRRSQSGEDGERVTSYIHEKLSEVTVIGASLDGEVRGADLNVSKGDSWALDAMIREL